MHNLHISATNNFPFEFTNNVIVTYYLVLLFRAFSKNCICICVS